MPALALTTLLSCDAIVYPPELPFRVAKLEELDDFTVAKFSAFEELDVRTVEHLPFRVAELEDLDACTVAKFSASFPFISAFFSFSRTFDVFTARLRTP